VLPALKKYLKVFPQKRMSASDNETIRASCISNYASERLRSGRGRNPKS